MNTQNENENPGEFHEARAAVLALETAEPEQPSRESADLRETVERGYGWGV